MGRRRLLFAVEQVAQIREMRATGATWRAIAAATGRSHFGCRRYWLERLGGAGGWARSGGAQNPSAPTSAPVRRAPLPAGSLFSWGAITSGAAIEGCAFKFDGGSIR